MTNTISRLLLSAAVLAAAAAAPAAARAQAAAGDLHLLDVPYLPQSEALCGGAAVAMVMRYWGATGVYAETFTDLVDRDAGGIRGADLLRDLQARGWEARSFRGDAALVQRQLAARRPVIALVEDRPGSYHYVVIVGWASGRVILHDPARAPFRVLDEATLMRAWEPTGFWTMLVTGGPNATRSEDATPPARTGAPGSGPCEGLVEQGVRLAVAGERGEARTIFEAASSNCPDSPAPWREMAGLHALDGRWPDAAADARRALARDPSDEQAARILATALYLEGSTRDALAAWNLVGEPRVDIVSVKGLERTRYAVAATALGVQPGDLLTPALLDRAGRRLDALPAAQAGRVAYTPGEDGAELDAVVIERPLAPTSAASLAVAGARALTDREAVVTIASPSGGGETWRASWRWWERRPRVAVAFDAPAPFGGTWGVGAAYERQAYATGAGVIEEIRQGASFRASDWTSRALRWELAGGIDDWRDRGRSVNGSLAIEQRLLADRVAVAARAAAWTLGAGAWTAALRSEWHSTTTREGQEWLARGGVAFAGDEAPLAAWTGAGTGQGRDLLLRAHPLLRDGVVRGAVFGRRVLDAGGEWRLWRPVYRGLLRVAPAVFVDGARATAGLPDSDTRTHVDVGGGMRVAVPGSGVLRLDVAHGLRGGGFVFSAGWTR